MDGSNLLLQEKEQNVTIGSEQAGMVMSVEQQMNVFTNLFSEINGNVVKKIMM